jgi:hypothetical protein
MSKKRGNTREKGDRKKKSCMMYLPVSREHFLSIRKW